MSNLKKRRKKGKLKPIDIPETSNDKDASKWQNDFTRDELWGRYQPIHELSHISYSIIYECRLLKHSATLKPGIKYKMEKIQNIFATENDTIQLLREVKILRILRNHDNIIRLHDILSPRHPKSFISLILIFNHISSNLAAIFETNQWFKTLHVQYILYQIISAVKYMHDAEIVHRDLKPSNILINADCCIKITNFQYARGFNEAPGSLNEYKSKYDQQFSNHALLVYGWIQTQGIILNTQIPVDIVEICFAFYGKEYEYRAPEAILGQVTYDKLSAMDMWSVGAIFAELLQMQQENCDVVSQRTPLFPKTYDKPLMIILDVFGSQEHQITTDCFRNLLPGAGKHALDLLEQLLKFDVNTRINASDALEQHPYFKPMRGPQGRTKSPKKFTFDTEKMKELEQESLRECILEEVIKYNRYDERRLVKSGAMASYKKKQEVSKYIAKQQTQ